jgi:protein-disulfide isomerase
MPDDYQLAVAPLEETVDHVRGLPAGRVILEYGDYECPYSRQAFHAIELVEQQLGGDVRFGFRHFPLTGIHPHALAAADAAEDAALQERFWDMHELLFRRQRRSKTATCAGTPSSSASTWRRSTMSGPARACWSASNATSTAA